MTFAHTLGNGRWFRAPIVLLLVAGLTIGARPGLALAESIALGEEHEMNLPAHQAFVFTQDALRADGILFNVTTDTSLVTLWRPINVPVGFFANLAGDLPRYRYEITAVPTGSHSSKVIVNLRGQNVTEAQLKPYLASKRLGLFRSIDHLVTAYPPSPETPATGGVNFALLPNEDLKGLAKRVTGNADNWRQIAKDNGIKSPTDVTPFESIWVRSSLLPSSKVEAAPAPSH